MSALACIPFSAEEVSRAAVGGRGFIPPLLGGRCGAAAVFGYNPTSVHKASLRRTKSLVEQTSGRYVPRDHTGEIRYRISTQKSRTRCLPTGRNISGGISKLLDGRTTQPPPSVRPQAATPTNARGGEDPYMNHVPLFRSGRLSSPARRFLRFAVT